jgi:aryl sulfotransferase
LTAVRYQSFLTDSSRWEGFQFRPGDIIISTPAKCGTTWTQMICALLVFQTPELPRPLDLLSPWLEMRLRRRREVFDLSEAQTHRRFIKSHTPLDGLPADERDAVQYWIDDPTPPEEMAMSLTGLLHHLAGFWEVRNRDDVVLLHYDDLQTDLEGEMRRLADRLDIEVPEERWPALVKAATFDEMRSRADERAPDTANRIWKSTTEFFHRGTSGQWEDLFDGDLAAHYESRVRRLAPPDFVAWLHRGTL